MSNTQVIRLCSAKHLESSEQQLTSVAGSLGYVAPEVLNQKGHGRPVDLWSIGYCCMLQIIHAAMEC
jgi:calcium/calmodulin-dependent protein kinase I